MREQLQQSVVNVASSPKVAASVAAGTTAAGTGTYLEWITPILGVTGTVVGIILSLVFIVSKIISTFQEFKINSMKIDELERCNMERGVDSTRRADP